MLGLISLFQMKGPIDFLAQKHPLLLAGINKFVFGSIASEPISVNICYFKRVKVLMLYSL